MPRSSKRAGCGSRCQVALALHHMQGQRGLAVLKVVKSCASAVGMVVLRRHDALDQSAHGLDPERERNHVEQQQVAVGVVARELVGLDRGAERDDPSGFRLVSGGWPKKSATAWRTTGMRVEPPTITTPLTSSLVRRIAQHAPHGGHGALGQLGSRLHEIGMVSSRSIRRPSSSTEKRTAAPSSAWDESASLTGAPRPADGHARRRAARRHGTGRRTAAAAASASARS